MSEMLPIHVRITNQKGDGLQIIPEADRDSAVFHVPTPGTRTDPPAELRLSIWCEFGQITMHLPALVSEWIQKATNRRLDVSCGASALVSLSVESSPGQSSPGQSSLGQSSPGQSSPGILPPSATMVAQDTESTQTAILGTSSVETPEPVSTAFNVSKPFQLAPIMQEIPYSLVT